MSFEVFFFAVKESDEEISDCADRLELKNNTAKTKRNNILMISKIYFLYFEAVLF